MSSSTAPETRIALVSATLHQPSKTNTVLSAIRSELEQQLGPDRSAAVTEINLIDYADALAQKLRGTESDRLQAAFEAVSSADLLVIGTPVYKASYTGLLKFFIDFLPQDALTGVPVILSANGGSQQHSLVIEHQLRPLFGFFRAFPTATGVYVDGQDFDSGSLTSVQALQLIRQAVSEALRTIAPPA